MKKKFFSLFMFICLALFIAACSSDSSGESDGGSEGNSGQASDEKEYNLQMSVTVGEGTAWYQGAEKFVKDIEEATDGRITIELFANEQLSGGDSSRAVELLSRGSIDLTVNSTIIYSILDDRFGVASAPFLFKDHEEVDAVFNGKGGEMLNEVLREKGVEGLGFGENGFRQVTNSVHEIQRPEDLQGLKMRIPGINMYTDLFRELGADPATMTWSEVFTSLQQNTIDGQENPIDVIYSSKINEVQDYITMWNYSYDPLVFGMNKKLFDSMSESDQELFKRVGQEAAAYQVELAREREAEQIAELEELGMQFYYPTEEDLAAFNEAVQPIYDQYKDIWGQDLLEAFTP